MRRKFYTMENLIFCLNVTIPIFLLMILGYILKKINIFTDEFIKGLNSFVFKIALPILLFQDLSQENFFKVWDLSFVLFCFAVTIISITFAIGISFLWKDKSIQGEFAQSCYRSSAALLGIGFIQNIYGSSGISPLMIIASVPLYNIMAVIILAFLKPERTKMTKALFLNTLKGIITNPIILGILFGMLWSVLKIPQPIIMSKTLKYLANLATPLGLMALGGSFQFKQAVSQLKPVITASIFKLILFCSIFLPIAVHLGFRSDKLISILVMLGSPTTVSCFIMAKNMGHKGTLSSSVIMLTTLCSAFTLTFWLYIIKTLGLI